MLYNSKYLGLGLILLFPKNTQYDLWKHATARFSVYGNCSELPDALRSTCHGDVCK